MSSSASIAPTAAPMSDAIVTAASPSVSLKALLVLSPSSNTGAVLAAVSLSVIVPVKVMKSGVASSVEFLIHSMTIVSSGSSSPSSTRVMSKVCDRLRAGTVILAVPT